MVLPTLSAWVYFVALSPSVTVDARSNANVRTGDQSGMGGGGPLSSSLAKSLAPNTILPPTTVRSEVVSAISLSAQAK